MSYLNKLNEEGIPDNDYNLQINESTQELNNSLIIINEIEDNFSNIDTLHWTHMPIIYKFSEGDVCREIRKNKILLAFNEITDLTNGTVYFKEGEDYDLLLSCSNSLKDEQRLVEGYWITTLGEGGINSISENRILEAIANFYPVIDSCGYYPFVEIHEILHCFGYGHNDKKACSIMSSYSDCKSKYDGCNKPYLNKEYISCLKYTYSNGKEMGDCSGVNFSDLTETGICSEGWYPVENSSYCCPEPNMLIDEEGYCSYF